MERTSEQYERQALLEPRWNEDSLGWSSEEEEYTAEMRAEDDRAREVKEEILDLYCEWDPRARMYEVKNWEKWGFINYANVDYVRADRVLNDALDCTKANGCYGARCYLASLDFDLEDLEYIRDTLKGLASYPILDDDIYYDRYYYPAWEEEFENWACTIRKAPWFDEEYARMNAEICDEDDYMYFANADKLIEEMKRRYAA